MNNTTAVQDPEENKMDLLAAPPHKELAAEKTDVEMDIGKINFDTTEELEPLDEIIGQNKAMSATELGRGIGREGYDIFVAGLTGTGKKETIRRSLEKRLDGSTVPNRLGQSMGTDPGDWYGK